MNIERDIIYAFYIFLILVSFSLSACTYSNGTFSVNILLQTEVYSNDDVCVFDTNEFNVLKLRICELN